MKLSKASLILLGICLYVLGNGFTAVAAVESNAESPVTTLKTDKVLGIPWGATEEETKRILRQRPKTRDWYPSSGVDGLKKWQSYIIPFNEFGDALLQVDFYQGKMYSVTVQVLTDPDFLMQKFNSVKEGMTERYGVPLNDRGKYLDAVVEWDLGGGYRVVTDIRKVPQFPNTPFDIHIKYSHAATEDMVNKAQVKPSGKEY